MYYALLTVSVLLFGIQFLFNRLFEKECGNRVFATCIFNIVCSIAGSIPILFIVGFRIEATPFTLLIAGINGLLSVVYTFCCLKAFARINLSLFSVFVMLGGMLLPTLAGIIFYNEPITVGKCLCVALVGVALGITVNKSSHRGGSLYYIGVFVLNGAFGVLSKIFESAPYPVTSEANYSLWIAIFAAAISVVLLPFSLKHREPLSMRAVLYSAGYGLFNRVASYLTLLTLAVLPASVQYPFITGGVMVVSTVISALTGQKPNKRELISVALAIVAVLLLVFLP